MKKRKKRIIKLKPLAKIILCVLVIVLFVFAIFNMSDKPQGTKNTRPKETIKKEEKLATGQINSVLEDEPSTEENIVEEEKHIETYVEPVFEDTYTTRMTSFWANDGYGTGDCTGSGLCSWDFQVNDKGWYTYNGKLVIATATTYLANQGWFVSEGVHLYKYWEELILTIDDVEYEAIILDSCGSSMRTDRVDLFVSNGSSAKDTTIQVRRK